MKDPVLLTARRLAASLWTGPPVPPATRTLAAGPCKGAAVLLTARRLAAGPCKGAAVLLALASVVVLAACASPSDGGTDDAGAPTSDAGDPAAGGGLTQADFDLQLTVDRGDGSAPEEWALSCGGSVQGSHPDPDAACLHLSGLSDPFAPVADSAVCTEQYGGPQTAHVVGRWAGEPVDVQLSRINGCLIAQWDSLGPLLPLPVG